MTRHFFIFLGTFVLGVLIALGARTARHQPHGLPATPAPAGSTPGVQPAAPAAPASAPPATRSAHAAHIASAAARKPVNTHCAICGMPVDPKLPTLEYQGQAIGFGCKLCPPKFQADPDKYGPLYLRNEVLKR